MKVKTSLFGIGLAGCGLIALLGAKSITTPAPGTAPGPAAVRVECSASGAKLFAPPMTSAAICERFAAALSRAMAADDSLTAELRFLPQGLASATVTHVRAGATGAPSRFELAVSDRAFAASDIDRLAADVTAALHGTPQ